MGLNIFRAGDILLPDRSDLHKWSVVACDQYTSQPEYWKKVRNIVGTSPSSYQITLPEIFLDAPNVSERISSINSTMRDYLNMHVFKEIKNSLIYVEREQKNGKIRKGIVGIVDLEYYDYHPTSQSPIRATEGTVLERIPPRVRVRENAVLELPHIMLLIDDDVKTVIEPLAEKKEHLTPAYSFRLMQEGGHIEGFIIPPNEQVSIMTALDGLADKKSFEEKYNVKGEGKGVLLFAAGDGNHSLATAKACFEKLKESLPQPEWETHPARYALVEVVNIHDEALEFEPIHRVLFDVNPNDVLQKLTDALKASETPDDRLQSIEFVTAGKRGTLYIKNRTSNLAVGSLQAFLDSYTAENKCRIDYIHGDDVAAKLGQTLHSIAFLLPVIKKRELFETVIKDGVLPRKTFSMGHASDKRFYLECRRIKK